MKHDRTKHLTGQVCISLERKVGIMHEQLKIGMLRNGTDGILRRRLTDPIRPMGILPPALPSSDFIGTVYHQPR